MQNNTNSESEKAQKRLSVFWHNALILCALISAIVLSSTVAVLNLGLAGLLSCFLPAIALFFIQQIVFYYYLSFTESTRRLRLWFLKLSTTILALTIIARFLSEFNLLVSELYIAGVVVGVLLNILGAVRFSSQLSVRGL